MNYVTDFIKDLSIKIKPLQGRLKKENETLPWTSIQTKVVQQIKEEVKQLLCLGILHPEVYPILETDALDIGFGGILKQNLDGQTSIVQY